MIFLEFKKKIFIYFKISIVYLYRNNLSHSVYYNLKKKRGIPSRVSSFYDSEISPGSTSVQTTPN